MKTNIPRWFRVYLRIYGILHIIIAVPWGLMFPFPIGGLLMLASGISALIARRWGAFPITILAFSVTYDIRPFVAISVADGVYHFAAAFTLLFAAQWFTAIMYWRFFFRRKMG